MRYKISVIEVFLSGGGTQSACIVALIVQGKLPRPNMIVIVDTERERSSVWEYQSAVIEPALSKIGMMIYRIKKSDFATVDLWSKGKGGITLPTFEKFSGQSQTYCSNEWKRRVIDRFLRSKGIKKREVRKWIGLSLDEANRHFRLKTSAEKSGEKLRFPLIEDIPLNRAQAIATVRRMGWPDPPRSACWMCPNQTGKEWRNLKLNYPDEFEKAVALEKEIQKREPTAFLHPARIPLSEIDFGNEADLWVFSEGCNSGMCFT